MRQLALSTTTVDVRPAAERLRGFFYHHPNQTMPENESSPSLDKSAAQFRESVTANFAAGSERMRRIETALEHNACATTENTIAIKAMAEQNKAMTEQSKATAAQNAEMYELFSTMKGGFKVLEWLGRLAKWAAAIVAGGAAAAKVLGWEWPFK